MYIYNVLCLDPPRSKHQNQARCTKNLMDQALVKDKEEGAGVALEILWTTINI